MPGPVLVTGGAGFVGSHVAEALLAAGRDVRILDNLHPAAHAQGAPYVPAGAEWIDGDVRDSGDVRAAIAGVSAVSHQASMVGLGVDLGDIADYVSHNALGTAVLLGELAAARFRGRFVLAGSMVVYGEGRYRCREHGPVRAGERSAADLSAKRFEPPCPHCGEPLEDEPIAEDAPADPRNVYAATKLHQEHLLAAYARELPGAGAVVLRYHNVYGKRMPRDTPYAGVASIFRSALAAGRAPRVFEDGGQRRDFVEVGDVARANVLALDAGPDAQGTFNIASGEPRTVGQMATALHAAAPAGAPAPEVTGEFRLGDVRHIVASPERARRVLGFNATIGFDEGMRAFSTAELR